MKRLLFLLNFFIVTLSFSQIPNEKLIGTWQLIEYKTSNDSVVYIGNSKFKRLKIINYNKFTSLDFNPAGNIIMSTSHGSYTLTPSKGIGTYDLAPDSTVIAETAYSVSKELAGSFGEEICYGLKIDSEDFLHYTNLNTSASETWMRIIPLRMEMLPALISKKKEDTLFKIDPRMLLILSNGSNQVEVKANAEFPQPLNVIKQQEIEYVEFLGDAQAIIQQGKRGHYGVFILAISNENFPKITKILRSQKNIR
jgi:hypothetical protein